MCKINFKLSKIFKKIIKTCKICGHKRIVNKHQKRDRCLFCPRKRKAPPHGKDHGNYKHGISKQGYKRIFIDKKRVQEHRYVFESYMGRQLKRGEVIHHIDFNKLNNDINNLYLCASMYEHMKINRNLEKLGYVFLNKFIWFDRENKKYVLHKTTNMIYDEPNIIFPAYSRKISMKKERNGCYYPKCQIRRHHFVSYYRIVIESFLKRKLKTGEYIHHINGNHIDNSINNLCVVTNKEHRLIEYSLMLCVMELYKKSLIYFDAGVYKQKLI